MSRVGAYRWLLAACFATLASCAAPTGDAPALPPVAAQAVAPTPQTPQSTPHYRIDAAASTLHILVYRGGTLARLGHNHVISSRSISGNIWRGSSHEDSGFSITVPVNTLIVDDNDARSAEGDDFPLNVTEDARQGTKVNMLRDTLLDGARYPEISIQSVRLQGEPDAPQVLATMRIKDQTRPIALPVTLRFSEGRLRVKGEFDIKQTDFGITPLNVALGALLVLDTIKIKFELVAKATLQN